MAQQLTIDQQYKTKPRQDERLFRQILVPISGEKQSWTALHQALKVARREDGRLQGLHIVSLLAQKESHAVQAIQIEFDRRCRIAGVSGGLTIEVGPVGQLICERAQWADLVVVSAIHPPAAQPWARFGSNFSALLRDCPKPVLAVSGPTSECRRPLLAYDGSPKAKEALSIARHLCGAERWRASLAVVSVLGGQQNAAGCLAEARAHLEACPAPPAFIEAKGPVVEAILATAAEHKSDFILMGGYGFSPMWEIILGSTVNRVLRKFRRPVLICL